MVSSMAALPETLRADVQVVDLRRISALDLAPVLAEEAQVWREALHWDLAPSIALIDRFVSMQSLNGFALVKGAHVIGYCYFVCEEHKGLIGDLYILRAEHSPERMALLLEAALDTLWHEPGIRRAEAQLLMLGSQPLPRIPSARSFRSFARVFFEIDANAVAQLPPRDIQAMATISAWRETHQQASGWLLAAAYRGHIDSEINDQYRSPGGARRFLTNIVQYPGCGSFFAPASFAVFERASNALCGMALASLVAPNTGHITQLCVAPSHKGTGVGYEMLRRSLQALVANGCETVGLTVTSANLEAIRLYQRMGFLRKREFSAWVWERRPA